VRHPMRVSTVNALSATARHLLRSLCEPATSLTKVTLVALPRSRDKDANDRTEPVSSFLRISVVPTVTIAALCVFAVRAILAGENFPARN
jgi:hypothetical protein